MAKRVSSFRVDERWHDWLDRVGAEEGTTKSALLEDALMLAEQTRNAAGENVTTMWQQIAERYGEDAEIMTWVESEDGHARARVRINGEEPDDLKAHVTVDAERGQAHVFYDFEPWSMVRYGSAYIGSRMYATLPIRSVVSFPWPPDEVQRVAALARIGDILHGGAREPQEVASL